VSITVIDSFGAANDAEIPSLALVLDPIEVQQKFTHCLRRLTGEHGFVSLQAIRVTRHKPGRRCVIEYNVKVECPDAQPESVVLIGKLRSKHRSKTGYRLLNALWNVGFRSNSPDGISVPEPIGFVPEYQLWLQRKVPGRVATDLLATPDGKVIVRHIAEAAYKLHQADIPAKRNHTMLDELRILREKLPIVVRIKPRWSERIEQILAASARISTAVPEPVPRGIHRDFYSDQVIVDGPRLYIIDFDLYCKGDPGLDIGNFIGHITEQSLRTLGDPDALIDIERAMEERFVELSGEKTRISMQVYAILTLVRHIYLSTLFPERQKFTESLIALCEDRLKIKQ
jgi:aminoglycoside phosphotransferase (APT) family kinase protein